MGIIQALFVMLGATVFPLAPLVLYMALSTAIAYAGYRIYERYKWSPPIWVGPVYSACGLAVMTLVAYAYGSARGGIRGPDAFFVALLPAFPILWVGGRMVAACIGGKVSESVYQTRFANRFPREYGKALQRKERGDIEGAIEAYRTYYEEAPGDVDPLIRAADLAEENDLADTARELYAKVRREFEDDPDIMAEVDLRCEALDREGLIVLRR